MESAFIFFIVIVCVVYFFDLKFYDDFVDETCRRISSLSHEVNGYWKYNYDLMHDNARDRKLFKKRISSLNHRISYLEDIIFQMKHKELIESQKTSILEKREVSEEQFKSFMESNGLN